MTYTPKILCFAGSLRRDSFNKKLIQIAMAGAKKAGADVTYVDLKDLPMAVYDGDAEAEQGLPENARKFKELLFAHQGLLIASPEYNSSISGALKNAIDWATRPATPDEKMLACFRGKVAGIMSASPGALGGLRGLVTVRSILENIGVIVVPNQVAVAQANKAFNDDGTLIDEKQHTSVEEIGARVAHITMRLFAEELDREKAAAR